MKLNANKIQECADWVRENGLVDYGGATKTAFCKAMDIDSETLRRWEKGNAAFAEAIKMAKNQYKENIEFELVVSLAKSAKGYTYPKTKTEYGDRNGKPYIRKQTKEDVHVQPNVGAAIFLLTNINPEKWQNKMNKEVKADIKADVDGSLDQRFNFEDLSDDMIEIADKLQEGEHKRVMKQKGIGE